MLAACTSADTSNESNATRAEARTLGESTATIREEFTAPVSVVEISDTRAVINDPRDSEVWQVDFATGERTLFGRTGDGPGEYRAPAVVLRLTADSVAVASAGPVPRVSVISNDGVPARSVMLSDDRFSPPSAAADTRAFSESPPQVMASDRAGRMYGPRPRLPLAFEPVTDADAQHVLVRFALNGDAVDTVTSVLPTNVRNARPVASGLEFDLPLGPFETSHAWTVLADGTVAVVDERTYGLVLYPVNAPAVTVGRIVHDSVPLAPDMWQQYVDSTRNSLLDAMKGTPTMLDGGGTPEITVRVPPQPTHIPPVLANHERRMLTDGEQLWIPVAGADPLRTETWEVLNREGRVLYRYALDAGVKLLAVTEQFLYTSVEREDGLKQEQRYARVSK